MALCAVGVLVCLAQLQSEAVLFRRGLFAVSFALAIGLVSAVRDYRYLISVGAVDQWQPMKLHADGRAIRSIVSRGPVLYARAHGPSGARAGDLRSLCKRTFCLEDRHVFFPRPSAQKQMGLVLEDELAAFLTGRPPAAILVGYERSLRDLSWTTPSRTDIAR